MKFKVNKYLGASYVGLIRTIALTMFPTVRPIAIKCGNESNVIDLGDSCEEDTCEFISACQASTYKYDGEGDFVVLKTTVGSVLNLDTVSKPKGFSILSQGVKEVLHVMTPVTVEIYFRKGYGKYTEKENNVFLKSKGIDVDNLTCFSSRHCAVPVFSYQEPEEDGDSLIYDINISATDGYSSEEVLKAAVEIAAKIDPFNVES